MNGQLCRINPLSFSVSGPAFSKLVAQIDLNDVEVESSKVYLPTPHQTRPAQEILDGKSSLRVLHDGLGFYISPPRMIGGLNTRSGTGLGNGLGKLSYMLYPCPPDTSAKRPTTSVSFTLDLTANPELNKKIEMLRDNSQKIDAQRRTDNIVNELKTIFHESFKYSHADAQALNNTTTLAGRCQRFIEHGKGVCYEFASTFAAVLEQSFRVKTRLCSGYHATQAGNIPRQGHRWVEYLDNTQTWQPIDPTPAVIRSVSSTTESEEATEYKHVSDTLVIFGDPGLRTPDWKGKFADIIQQISKIFSLEEVGLVKASVQRGGINYKASPGQLSIKRLLNGNPQCFEKSNLQQTKQIKKVIFYADIYDLTDTTIRERAHHPKVNSALSKVLLSFLKSSMKVKIFGYQIRNKTYELVELQESSMLDFHKPNLTRIYNPPDDILAALREDDNYILHDLDFLENSIRHFYQCYLTLENKLPETYTVEQAELTLNQIKDFMYRFSIVADETIKGSFTSI